MPSVLSYPSTAVNDSTVGTIPWLNVTRVVSDNASYATVGLSAGNVTRYARASGFDFSSIPSGSTIKGILVEIERYNPATGGTPVTRDSSVKLYKNGTGFVGDEKADTGTNWPTSPTVKSYGGAADLWGTTWTLSEVQNDLQIGIAAVCTTAGAGDEAAIDFIRITVTYTAPIHFTGSTDLGWPGGVAAITGGIAAFSANQGLDWGGSAAMIADHHLVATADLDWGGTADIGFNFSFKWSIEHLEARIDYGFPTVWVEISNNAQPSGAFPSGSFFERRILEIPQLQDIELDSRYGISGFQQVSIAVDNSDGLIASLDLQGAYVRMFFIDDSGATIREFNGQVTDWTLSHRCILNVEDVDYLTIAQDLPKRTLNGLVEAEKTADGTFENYVISNDLGKPIPIIFGRAIKVPLLYVKANESAREYDYIIGEGEGFSGNNFQEVFTVYRNDQALDEINGSAQSGSSASALKLESGDQRPDSWYKYWWVEIVSGPGAGDIRHVTAYVSSTNIITPNSNFSATLTTSSVYKLTEWRFYNGSQASPYDGYAFIRFKKRMGVSGRTDSIYADVNGFADETNSVRAIRSLLSNTAWGLGLTIDSASFTAAAALSDIDNMLSEGAIIDTTAAIDIFTELLGFRDMVLSKGDNIEITVDQAKTSSFNFGLGDDYGWNNILTASPEIVHIHPNEKTRNLKVKYRKNYKENDLYQYELERSSSTNGIDRIINLPFVYDHETADRWLDYKRKRYATAVKRLSLTVGQEGDAVRRGDMGTLHIPSLGLVASEWEITGATVVIAGQNTVNLVPYGSLPYTYVPITDEGGELPVDESFDIPPDYTASIPDPVSSVSVTMSMGIVGFTASPFATLTWTAPEDNYGGAVISVKLHSDATSLFRVIGTYTGTTARIEGLVPGQLYDFLVESLNVTGQYKGLGVLVDNSGSGYIAGGDSTAPGTWTHNLNGEAKHGILSWWWDKHPASDVSHYEYEIYSATSGGSILPGGKGIVPHSSKSNTQPRVEYKRQSGNLTSSLVGALRVRAIDHSGNPNDETTGWTPRFGLSTGAVIQQDVTTSEIQLLGQDSSGSGNLSVTVTLRGKPVDLAVSWIQSRDAGVILTIRKDGATNLVVHSWGSLDQACHAGAQSFYYRDVSPGTGSHTYEVLFGNGAFSSDRKLTVKENRNG